jgi:hypothetical protein
MWYSFSPLLTHVPVDVTGLHMRRLSMGHVEGQEDRSCDPRAILGESVPSCERINLGCKAGGRHGVLLKTPAL